jgi:hypothetical protein
MAHHVSLFIPCYMDAFEPEVGIATLELLERLGCSVDYPFDQTCCGQPMVNTGCHKEAAATERLFVENFSTYDYIVCPSGSCTHQVRANLTAIKQTDEVRRVRANIYELTEFLHDVLKVDALPWTRFPHKVGIHYSCNSPAGSVWQARASCVSLNSRSRRIFCRWSRTSSSSSRRVPTSAAGLEGLSVSLSPLSPPRWATTKSLTTPKPARNTLFRLIRRACFTRRDAPIASAFPSNSSTSPASSMEPRHDRRHD